MNGVPYYLDDPPEVIQLPIITTVGGDDPPPWVGIHIDTVDRGPSTLDSAIQQFINHKRAEVEQGMLSAARLSTLHNAMKAFGEWASFADVKKMAGNVLVEWRDELFTRITAGDWRAATAKTYIDVAKQFTRWLYERDYIDTLPRCLTGKSLAMPSPTPNKIVVMTDREVGKLLLGSTEPMRLYLLLMLNCGFYQGDIADLRQNEVDWRKRTITRRRSKTRKHKSPPTVTYPLWPLTYKLLKKYRQPTGELVLRNQNGLPLVRRTNKGGTDSKTDNIAKMYERLARRLKISKPLKSFRKTGADKLQQHETYRTLVPLYLGHAPHTVADRHYVRPPQELFNEAITWLAGQLLPPELT